MAEKNPNIFIFIFFWDEGGNLIENAYEKTCFGNDHNAVQFGGLTETIYIYIDIYTVYS